MITNYYTLLHVSAELDRVCRGKKIAEVFTQHRGELVVLFEDSSNAIIAGCEPSDNFIYLRKSFARARRNSADVFKDIVGSTIKAVRLHPADRQIHIQLQEECEIIVQLFGSKANALLVNGRGEIDATFLKKEEIRFLKIDEVIQDEVSTTEILKNYNREEPLNTVVKKIFPRFGAVLIQELILRTGLSSDIQIQTLTVKERERILSVAEKMKEELLTKPSFRIYFQEEAAVRLALIPLQHYAENRLESFESISEAIHFYRSNIFHEKSQRQDKAILTKTLIHEREHLENTLGKIAAEAPTESAAAQHERSGKLIKAHIHLLQKGETSAVVEDVLTGSGEIVEIPMDPHLNPAKNAERYFEKSRKAKTAFEEQRARIAELSQQKNMLAQLLESLEEVHTDEELQIFISHHQRELKQFGFKPQKSGQVRKEEPLPFRVFTVDGGFQVWAGKSGENNDLLSTRHTAKNDLWFHARGIGGSHVILKLGTGKGEVSKRAIEQAAGIAAYYSKMKNSSLVPVAMCEGKYVRKPKGVPAGTVTIEREKTIFAKPKLPE
jgi:predicted ribosome quality control (RQC) complex YloA/Tae2 family protein